MGEINIPNNQKDALNAIKTTELEKLIEQTIREEQSGELHSLHLSNCGLYIAKELHYFDQALEKHIQAKAPKKRAETKAVLEKAGRNLLFAFGNTKRRMETEQEDGQFFYIEDQILPPDHFGKRLSVRLNFRWRRTVDDEWTFGSITFFHEADLHSNYLVPVPKQKPSVAKQKQDQQTELFQTWQYLMRGALYSLRDYFKDGGDGGKVPEIFHAVVNSHTRELNNYSTQFWR